MQWPGFNHRDVCFISRPCASVSCVLVQQSSWGLSWVSMPDFYSNLKKNLSLKPTEPSVSFGLVNICCRLEFCLKTLAKLYGFWIAFRSRLFKWRDVCIQSICVSEHLLKHVLVPSTAVKWRLSAQRLSTTEGKCRENTKNSADEVHFKDELHESVPLMTCCRSKLH